MIDYLSLPKNPNEYVIITTNGIIKKNGELVMGAGLALLAAQQYPQLTKQLGKYVAEYGNRCFIVPKCNLISFPTKHHYKDKSDWMLIEKSLGELKLMINGRHNIEKIYMPRIGCRNGGLDWKEVKPLIEKILAKEIEQNLIQYTEP